MQQFSLTLVLTVLLILISQMALAGGGVALTCQDIRDDNAKLIEKMNAIRIFVEDNAVDCTGTKNFSKDLKAECSTKNSNVILRNLDLENSCAKNAKSNDDIKQCILKRHTFDCDNYVGKAIEGDLNDRVIRAPAKGSK